MKISNIYFTNPFKWDLGIGLLVVMLSWIFLKKNIIEVPCDDFILSSVSDIANISFSSSGFILTILTVLITFKAGSQRKEKIENYDSALDLFFQTSLYSTTTNLLKDCIKVLIGIGLIGYMLKIILPVHLRFYIFFFIIFSLLILSLTLTRCLLILSKVLALQTRK